MLAGSQIMLWLAFRFEGQVSQGCLFFRNGIGPLQLERRDNLCVPLSLFTGTTRKRVYTSGHCTVPTTTPLLRGLCLVSKRRLGQWQSSNEGWQESFERQNESGRTLVVYVGQNGVVLCWPRLLHARYVVPDAYALETQGVSWDTGGQLGHRG